MTNSPKFATTIDWRNDPDRVIDVLGPKIVLPPDGKILSPTQLTAMEQKVEDLSRAFRRDPEIWRPVYTAHSALKIRLVIDSAKTKFADQPSKQPLSFRFGMDRENANLGNSVIRMQPYLLVQGGGYYKDCAVEAYGNNHQPVLHKQDKPFGNLYVISEKYRLANFKPQSPDIVDVDQMVNLMQLITARSAKDLRGEYDIVDGLRVAYRGQTQKVVTLDEDYGPSRKAMVRNYETWKLDNILG